MMQPPKTKAITRWTGFCFQAIRTALSTQAGPSQCVCVAFGLLLLLSVFQNPLIAVSETSSKAGDQATAPAVLLEVDEPLGPAIDDYLCRAFEQAGDLEAPVIIIRMNTPGGLDTSMRAIIRKILDSPIPVAVYIAPEGARGASAGTYILYAAHIAAMAPATSVGAATPVQIGGTLGGERLQAEEKAAKNAPNKRETPLKKIKSETTTYPKRKEKYENHESNKNTGRELRVHSYSRFSAHAYAMAFRSRPGSFG